jgi:hypothetical protein
MRRAGLALLLASLAPAVLADDLARTAIGDIDGDGVPDRVEISPSGGNTPTVNLKVSLSASERTIQARGFSPAEYGLPPEIDDHGEVHLSFEWLSGRYKSSTDIVLGLQSRELVVLRYKTAVADSVSQDSRGNPVTRQCEADFVANRTTVDGQPAEPPPGPPIAVTAWRGLQSVPKACRSLF